ncbi:MAG: AAA family ATPase [Candidatus Binatia bacterium]
MYEAFFGLRDLPFRDIPDPRFLVASPAFRAAADALAHGIAERRGILTLVAPAGTGKTLLLRHLAATLASPRLRVVVLPHPGVSFDELLEFVGAALGVPPRAGATAERRRSVRAALVAEGDAGRNVALLIDEAQALPVETLRALGAFTAELAPRGRLPPPAGAGRPAAARDDAAHRGHPADRHRGRRAGSARCGGGRRVRARPARARGRAGPHALHTARPRPHHAAQHGVPRLVNVLCDGSLTTAFRAQAHDVGSDAVRRFWDEYQRADLVAWPPVPPDRLAPPAPAQEVRPTNRPRPAPVAPGPPTPPPAARPTPPVRPSGTVLAPPTRHVREHAADAPSTARRVAAAAAGILIVAGVGVAILWRAPDTGGPPPPVSSHPPAAALTPWRPVRPEDIATVHRTRAEDVAASGNGPSAAEAVAVVDEFRLAWEARSVERLRRVLAPEVAVGSRHGADAFVAGWTALFTRVDEVVWLQPTTRVEPSGTRVAVRAPFALRFRERDGAPREVRGSGVWEVERVDGQARIVRIPDELGTAPGA